MPYVVMMCEKCGAIQERHHNATVCCVLKCRGRLWRVAPDDGMEFNVNVTREQLEAEVEQLRAIVDRLPHTADGVPVSERRELWFWFDGRMRSWMCPAPSITGAVMWHADDPDDYTTIFPSDCYSTREAAEAARRNE